MLYYIILCLIISYYIMVSYIILYYSDSALKAMRPWNIAVVIAFVAGAASAE